MPIDRSKPCEWWSWNGRDDAFETNCTGFIGMPYFIKTVPAFCVRCGRPTKLLIAEHEAENQ